MRGRPVQHVLPEHHLLLVKLPCTGVKAIVLHLLLPVEVGLRPGMRDITGGSDDPAGLVGLLRGRLVGLELVGGSRVLRVLLGCHRSLSLLPEFPILYCIILLVGVEEGVFDRLRHLRLLLMGGGVQGARLRDVGQWGHCG